MRCQTLWAAAALAGWLATPLSASESRAKETNLPAITVVVYNYAGVAPKALGETKRVATRILQTAGIETRWRNARHGRNSLQNDLRFGPDFVFVRLLSAEMTKRLGFDAHQYGFTQSAGDGGFPCYASVFYPRAERLARGTPSLVPIILGHLVAHEIGHLLLGAQGHSSQGIMRAPWSEADLRAATRGRLGFSSSEARRIHADVSARMEAAKVAAK